MKLLLDTHAFIWMDDDDSGRLSGPAIDAIEDVRNTLYVSVASLGEIQIKTALGKLALGRPLKEAVFDQRQLNDVRILSVRSRHVFALDWIPDHHRDPFDRLLIAQAIRDELTLVTCDPQIMRYPVSTLW